MAKRDNSKKLIDAILDNKIEEAEKLLNGEIDLNIETRGDYAIHAAARVGQLKLIKKMKGIGANLQQKNVNGNTPMHYAARGGHIDIVKYLKQHKADPNVTNMDGEAPLHFAVIQQPMDVIETLIDLGMNPNKQSKETGLTPLHAALMYGRMEAMEGLLIKGAKPDLVDNKKQKPEEVAKTAQIRDSLRMYRALLNAMESGYIEAKGIKITTEFLKEARKIERVNILLESIDIPAKFAAGFYCRREKSENATVKLPKHDEEQVFSDVFHIRVSDVTRDCPAKIGLPLYSTPSDKEEMVLRFIDCEGEDKTVKEVTEVKKMNYCRLETTLIPETTCICAVFVRPKKEDKTVSGEGMVIKSAIEENFTMDIPAGAFEQETTLSLKVYEANDGEYVDNGTNDDASEEKKADVNTSTKPKTGLLSDVFQINVSGEQPKKGVKMQIPLSAEMRNMKDEDIAIITGDETQLEDDESVLTISSGESGSKPKIVNGMIVFEVSHFCIYVAAPMETVASPNGILTVQRQVSSARDRKKPGTFFVVARKTEGRLHTIIVECLSSSRSEDRRNRLVKEKGYEPQTPDESESIMMTPGDTFTISIKGRTRFEDESDLNRKLTFSPNRSSTQAFTILLDDDVTEESDAIGVVIFHKQLDEGASKEVSRLNVQLHPPPPRPPTPPTPASPVNEAAKHKVRRESTTVSRHSNSNRDSTGSRAERRRPSEANDIDISNKSKLKALVNIYSNPKTPRK